MSRSYGSRQYTSTLYQAPSVNNQRNYPTNLCQFHGSAKGCSFGNDCKYSHGYPNSIPLCTYHKSPKGCALQNKCNYRHQNFYCTPSHCTKPKMNPLVAGYLKREFLRSNTEYQYPESLTLLFIQFLGNILLRFDMILEKYRDFISDDGQILEINNEKCKLNETITVGCSYPFESGIYKVIVQYHTKVYSPIGIISDKGLCNQAMWIFGAPNVYAYALYPEHLCQTQVCRKYSSNGGQNDVFDYHWHANDIAKLIINCDEWILTYYVNDKQIGEPVNIAKDIKYYMAISLNFHEDSKYEILSFDHKM